MNVAGAPGNSPISSPPSTLQPARISWTFEEWRRRKSSS